jgi:hypothetical protein
MNRVCQIFGVLFAAALVVGCGLKAKERHGGPEPEVVEAPEETDPDPLDIDNGTDTGTAEEAAALPMETDFLEWEVVVDEAPRPARIGDAITRTLTFKLNNTLERLLTGRIIIDAPPGVLLAPGTTIGWRMRGGRAAEIPAQLTLVEGAPLGRLTLPVTITVLGEEYRSTRLALYKWIDVRVIGPFPEEAEGGSATAYPPEKKVDFKRGCKWEGVRLAWRPLPIEALHPDGMIDFTEILGDSAKGCAYAALNLYAEAATGVVLAFACDSPSTVWLNGRQVLSAPEPLDEEMAVEVTLKKGRNTLLVKCRSGEKGWACILNVAGKQGELPPGVTFDLVLRQSVGASTADTSGERLTEE